MGKWTLIQKIVNPHISVLLLKLSSGNVDIYTFTVQISILCTYVLHIISATVYGPPGTTHDWHWIEGWYDDKTSKLHE